MKAATWVLCGITLGIGYVLITGVLTIQAIGQEAGAVFDLNNKVVAVTSPQHPFLPMLGIAALSTLVLCALTIGVRRRTISARIALIAAFSGTTTALVILSFLVAAAPGYDLEGVASGLKGWLEKGGSNSAVHSVLFIAIGSAWFISRSSRSGSGGNVEATWAMQSDPLDESAWVNTEK